MCLDVENTTSVGEDVPRRLHVPYPAREWASQLRTWAGVEPESLDLAEQHSHIFVESGPNRTTLMFSGITLNFSRIGQDINVIRRPTC